MEFELLECVVEQIDGDEKALSNLNKDLKEGISYNIDYFAELLDEFAEASNSYYYVTVTDDDYYVAEFEGLEDDPVDLQVYFSVKIYGSTEICEYFDD